MKKIALVAVAYNRVDSLTRLIESLQRAEYCQPVDLIISVDKSKTTIVEEYAESVKWAYGNKYVDKHKTNLGLRPHMMSLGKWFSNYDAIVVLEDDLVVSPFFFNYAQQTVDKYFDDDNIAGISLYRYGIINHTGNIFTPINDGNDVFFMQMAISWGQIWMKKQWAGFYEWYKTVQQNPVFPAELPDTILAWDSKSWLKFHDWYCFSHNKYFVMPQVALSTCYSDAGVHTIASEFPNVYQVPLLKGRIESYRLPDFASAMHMYDIFFENKSLYKKLGLDENHCCIDINGANKNKRRKKYHLTTSLLPFKVIKSYAMELKPVESNILEGIEGNDIFLYDCTAAAEKPYKGINKYILYTYSLHSLSTLLNRYGFKYIIRDIYYKIIKK